MRGYQKTRLQKVSGSLLCSGEKVYAVIDIMSLTSLDISLRASYIAPISTDAIFNHFANSQRSRVYWDKKSKIYQNTARFPETPSLPHLNSYLENRSQSDSTISTVHRARPQLITPVTPLQRLLQGEWRPRLRDRFQHVLYQRLQDLSFSLRAHPCWQSDDYRGPLFRGGWCPDRGD